MVIKSSTDLQMIIIITVSYRSIYDISYFKLFRKGEYVRIQIQNCHFQLRMFIPMKNLKVVELR